MWCSTKMGKKLIKMTKSYRTCQCLCPQKHGKKLLSFNKNKKEHKKNGEDLHARELHGTMNFLHTNIDRCAPCVMNNNTTPNLIDVKLRTKITFHVPFGCNVKKWCHVKHYDQRIGQTWASHPMSIQLYKLLHCHRVIHKVILSLNLCSGCIQGRCFFT